MLLILLMQVMSGSSKNPTCNPTFPTKNPTFGSRKGGKPPGFSQYSELQHLSPAMHEVRFPVRVCTPSFSIGFR
jgi:hypothetical protein